jgi:hypothetical protein
MNQNIMQKEIEYSVQTDSDSHPKPIIKIFQSQENQYYCNTSKEQRKQIVQLKERLRGLMMGLMYHPKRTMHQVLVNQPTGKFHYDKSQCDKSYSFNHHENN